MKVKKEDLDKWYKLYEIYNKLIEKYKVSPNLIIYEIAKCEVDDNFTYNVIRTQALIDLKMRLLDYGVNSCIDYDELDRLPMIKIYINPHELTAYGAVRLSDYIQMNDIVFVSEEVIEGNLYRMYYIVVGNKIIVILENELNDAIIDALKKIKVEVVE